METIGQRVRNLRYKRGYTRQVEFAPMVSMTQSSLSDAPPKSTGSLNGETPDKLGKYK